MNRSSIDAAVAFLTRAQRGVLLLVPETPSTDTFASMLALGLALDRLGKSPTMISPSFVPEHLQFLPGTSQVRNVLDTPTELIVEIPVGNARPRDVQWDIAEKYLRIRVNGKGQTIGAQDIRVRPGSYPWDAVVVLGTPRREALGSLLHDHASLFAETPLMNIDRGTENTFFGTVNVILPHADTVSEVVLALLEALGGDALTPEVATCLFAGITAATDSFRSPSLASGTLRVASQLLSFGADHQQVVRHLFRTHTLAELRLLGRALARLEELRSDAVLTIVSDRDFAASEATPDVMPSILKEIREWTGQTRTTFLAFARTPDTFEVLIAPRSTLAEQHEALRASLNGVSVGPFLLVNLGMVTAERVPDIVRTELLPRLSDAEKAERATSTAAVSAADTSAALSASARA
ncbi:MAG: phosphoesterase RecJ domain-containing protein [Parcubacteria group bacterium Gr01-1014_106]|nr:MAG: phosphoesterase RecJ domain-containing protein [Parcubacteria group bacterium Gr01-1014_106]